MASSSEVVLVRHGETEWSRSGQHTSHTDLPLTDEGERQARALGERLAGREFALVLSSSRRRALDTGRLAGLADPVVDDDLAEWDYGTYEGLTTATIAEDVPGWTVWTGSVPGGETAAQVGERADRALERARAAVGDVALLSHGHLLRVLAARWVGLPPEDGGRFVLSAGSLSVLGYEHGRPVIRSWNGGLRS